MFLRKPTGIEDAMTERQQANGGLGVPGRKTGPGSHLPQGSRVAARPRRRQKPAAGMTTAAYPTDRPDGAARQAVHAASQPIRRTGR
jgi:hypothetical protein